MKVIKQLGHNLFALLSMILNTLLLGSPKETLSERTARAYNNNTESWFMVQRGIIDVFVWMITLGKEKNHTLRSLEEESVKEIWPWD